MTFPLHSKYPSGKKSEWREWAGNPEKNRENTAYMAYACFCFGLVAKITVHLRC